MQGCGALVLVACLLATASVLFLSLLRPHPRNMWRDGSQNTLQTDALRDVAQQQSNITGMEENDILCIYNTSGGRPLKSDEAVFVTNLQHAHLRLFRNLRKEGARLSSLFNRGVPLLKPLSFHQQNTQTNVHYARQELRRIDDKLRNLNHQLQKRQARLAMVEERKAALKQEFIAEMSATAAERWSTLENDKDVRVDDLGRRIAELEQLRRSVEASYAKKQELWESTVPETEFAELNRRQAKVLEAIQGARAESASLAREVQLYSDAKASAIKQLAAATELARESHVLQN